MDCIAPMRICLASHAFFFVRLRRLAPPTPPPLGGVVAPVLELRRLSRARRLRGHVSDALLLAHLSHQVPVGLLLGLAAIQVSVETLPPLFFRVLSASIFECYRRRERAYPPHVPASTLLHFFFVFLFFFFFFSSSYFNSPCSSIAVYCLVGTAPTAPAARAKWTPSARPSRAFSTATRLSPSAPRMFCRRTAGKFKERKCFPGGLS